jgi:hypothetical protein
VIFAKVLGIIVDDVRVDGDELVGLACALIEVNQ